MIAKLKEKWGTVLFVVILAAFFIVNNIGVDKSEGPYPPDYKKDAPKFSFQLTTGETITNESIAGKVVILDFWASSIEPCIEEINTLNKLNEKYGDRIEIIGISLDNLLSPGKDVLNEFLKKNPVKFKVGICTQELSKAFGDVTAIPLSYILGKDGKVYYDQAYAETFDIFTKKLDLVLSLK